MSKFSSRRGSALLIVLGMMSFIVVSAVAFSAYMRYSRLPSSYLRRTSATRMLAKAALAQAIDRIDREIGNCPYPGVGNPISNEGEKLNLWRDRVFVGAEENDLPEPEETIATLNMEALAYIPMPFINEMRYWSRRSKSAIWRNLGYDSGRYAFSALDVSDCFDINKVAANAARDSSDYGRITLGGIFKTPNNPNAPVAAAAWDDFVKKYNTSALPLVSVADLNLAINNDGPSGLDSPFCNYLTQGNNAKFVKTQSGATADFNKSLAFLTTSYFPMTNETDRLDLTNADHQPFKGFALAQNDTAERNDDTLERVMLEGRNKFLEKYLNPAEAVALYDYLDQDDIPMSLALPTTERVPMITGVSLDGQVVITSTKHERELSDPQATIDPQSGNPTTKLKVTVLELGYRSEGPWAVSAGFVYPFNTDRGQPLEFQAQAAMTVTLVPAGDAASLRRSGAKVPAVYTKDQWTTSKKAAQLAKYGNEKVPVVATMQSAPQRIQLKRDIYEERDAVPNQVVFNFDDLNLPLSGEFDQVALLGGVDLPNEFKQGAVRIIQRINAQTKQPIGDPVVQNILQASNGALNGVENMQGDTKYVPTVQVWVRVINKSGKTVDLVPACSLDDEQAWSELPMMAKCAKPYPLVRFYPKNTEEAAITGAMIGDPTTMPDAVSSEAKYQLYLADDPRFNYAPENLMAIENVSESVDKIWLKTQRSASRDGDIFMMTSDSGYLQSKYELTALPAISGSLLNGSGNRSESYDGNFNGVVRTSFENTPANRAMWTTYSQFQNNGRVGDLDAVKLESGSNGFRINPFTRDPNVMYAAIGDAPLGWYESGTNVNMKARSSAFGEITMSDGKTKRKVIKPDAARTYCDDEEMQEKFKELSTAFVENVFKSVDPETETWEDAFDDQNIWRTKEAIAGVDFSGLGLFSTDKKFLYGFWRESFANRQQLFLIFVRAEPVMMGGGALGTMPPQLGARAVALVWRDPSPTARDNVGNTPRPHRTRVLFYRQLD